MLIKSTDAKRALDYIGEDYIQCFYMYMDIEECGVEGEGFGLWFDEEDGEINTVYYQYYDCIHIFGRGPFNPDYALQLIEEIDPTVINGSKEAIEALRERLDEDKYEMEVNHIITANKEMEGNMEVNIAPAQESDIPEIAKLMLKADIFSNVYTYEGLVESLTRRLEEGFGRLFIIRDENGTLIATNATNAETDKLAVIGGLVTDPDMRGRGLGRAITASTWNLVRNEGKRGLAFLITDNMNTVRLHQKMGYDFVGYSARLIKK